METKFCNKCSTEKSRTEFYAQKSKKDGLCTMCKVCDSAKSAARYLAKRDDILARQAAYEATTKEAKAAREAARYLKTRDERAKKNAARYAAKRKEISEKAAARYASDPKRHAARNANWARDNLERMAAKSAKRRAAKLQATPAWADLAAIELIYAESARLTRETGIEHHVDHVVPLQSILVCGLHCETNLKVLPGSENIRKHNRYWPDMP
jgi:hypothetical protein